MVIVQIVIDESGLHFGIDLLKREDATSWEWESAKAIEADFLVLFQEWAVSAGGELKVTRIDGPPQEQANDE